MRHKPQALILIGLLALALAMTGCRRSAAPTLEPLEPEDESTAMVQEAQENTEQMEEAATPTTAPTESGDTEPAVGEVEEEVPTPTTESEEEAPVVEAPAPTTELQEQPPVEEQVTEPVPTTTTPGVYVVKPGDNLFRIALRHGLTVSQLAQANNITNPSQISVGQELTIPAGGDDTTTPDDGTTAKQCSVVHVVKAGENLFRIALRYNVSLPYLAQYNAIANPSNVYVGQPICIP